MSGQSESRKGPPVSADTRGLEPLGAKIRRLREGKGLAQDRLAIEAHVDQSGLSKFERGVSARFGPVPLSRIASILGLTLEQLIEGTDYRKR